MPVPRPQPSPDQSAPATVTSLFGDEEWTALVPPTDPATAWDAPIPLDSSATLPTFPTEALPNWVRRQVEAVAEFTQTPPDMAATMALAALATAAGGRVHAEIRPGWREQTNLYLVCAMPPASRKSDVFAAMTDPVYRIEDDMKAAARSRIIEAQAAKDAAEAEVDALMARARKPGENIDRTAIAIEIASARMLAEEIKVPPIPRLTVSDDITPESLTQQLSVHRCLAALSPEGDLFDVIAGRYSSKPNLGVFLKGHKGERLQPDRISREQSTVDKPALTIGVTPQPAVLQDLGSVPGARDRGLLARFLYALPPSNLGYRRTRTAPIPEAVANTYESRLSLLVHTLTALPEPVTVPLTPAADLEVEKLQDRLELQLRPEQPLSHIKEWAGKLVGHTVRIAALLHLADRVSTDWGQPVEADAVTRAAKIADYYTAHTLAVFDLIAADPATDDAQAILDWLRRPKQDGTHRQQIKAYDAVACSRRFKKVADVEPALRLLEQHGYLRNQTTTSAGRGRQASPTFHVHPQLNDTPAQPTAP
ncbi:YfjI family protein [Kitasatospora sp. NPDC058965]|uniref:YfjI family protein n=1 Tax=Kitasatospora sp. NPDC058965 TaxID=3346682 RepID=UPI003677F6E3